MYFTLFIYVILFILVYVSRAIETPQGTIHMGSGNKGDAESGDRKCDFVKKF